MGVHALRPVNKGNIFIGWFSLKSENIEDILAVEKVYYSRYIQGLVLSTRMTRVQAKNL